MKDTDTNTQLRGRTGPRADLDGRVRVRFETDTLVGSGENIATQGVFFTADGGLRVTVEIEGVAGTMAGELVRIESMGDGRLGIAVKFAEPNPDLASDS
jgi:hypothetical protein